MDKLKRAYVDTHGHMPVTIMQIGGYDTNTYVISDGNGEGAPTMVIDPAGDAQAIMKAIGWKKVEVIVATHEHNDHLVGLPDLVKMTGAPVVASVKDSKLIESGQPGWMGAWDAVAPVKVDRKVSEGDIIELGSLKFRVLMTPGHTPGGMCLLLESDEGPDMLFAGDTLFNNGVGRVDFDGGSARDLRKSLRRLATLPETTVVYPGHGPYTTIKAEKKRTLLSY